MCMHTKQTQEHFTGDGDGIGIKVVTVANWTFSGFPSLALKDLYILEYRAEAMDRWKGKGGGWVAGID